MHICGFEHAVSVLNTRFSLDVTVIALGQALMDGASVLKDTEIIFDRENLSFAIDMESAG